MNNNPLKNIVNLQKKNLQIGIYSACSANVYVIKAVLKKAKDTNSVALIEATANQVDQFGGYTGMKPIDFYNFVMNLAKEENLDSNRVFLGGDHLGPLTWSNLPEDEAMKNATELIKQYVMAGFTKIHVDTSMKVLDDDKDIRLSDEVIARRGAYLVKVADESYKELLKTNKDAVKPVYIVGSEVPIPGGQTSGTGEMQITTTSDLDNTINSFKNAFSKENIDHLWEDVIGIVVQPGVEEKDAGCTEYDRSKATHLKQAIKKYDTLVYEGHSTDYQTKHKLKEMVEDHIAILKVGPGLTFAAREALYALSKIEDELFDKDQTSNFIEILDQNMLANPSRWASYYKGTNKEIKLKRQFSFSDRCRYYLPTLEVQTSIDRLINNLNSIDEIPLNLLSQYMPIQYTKVREGVIANNAESLIIDRITNTIDEYCYATNQDKLI